MREFVVSMIAKQEFNEAGGSGCVLNEAQRERLVAWVRAALPRSMCQFGPWIALEFGVHEGTPARQIEADDEVESQSCAGGATHAEQQRLALYPGATILRTALAWHEQARELLCSREGEPLGH
jgi:hypothetical protein